MLHICIKITLKLEKLNKSNAFIEGNILKFDILKKNQFYSNQ